MGIYDTLPKGSQVKCWDCNMEEKRIGDIVLPSYDEDYIVLLQEGGYVRVSEDVITEIVEDGVPRYPEEFAPIGCIDKWGEGVSDKESLEGRCMFDYHYYFIHDRKKEVKK